MSRVAIWLILAGLLFISYQSQEQSMKIHFPEEVPKPYCREAFSKK